MQIKQLVKLSRLHKNDLKAIQHLVDFCFQVDKYKIKLYWNILQNRLTQEFNDLFYFIDGNLVGYCALFTFSVEEAELSIVVHPKYRRIGIYKKLLAEVLLELKQRRIPQCLCICPQSSFINLHYLRPFKPKFVFSQLEMMTRNVPHFPHVLESDMHLRLAEPSDLKLLAEIGSIGFNANFNDTLQRFTDNIRDKHRKIWLASIPEKENIGKVHVRYDANQTVFIHDLCILPQYRGHQYAFTMMVKIMKMLHHAGQKIFMLDMELHNQPALKLYEKCGFQPVSVYDFWRVPVENVLKKNDAI